MRGSFQNYVSTIQSPSVTAIISASKDDKSPAENACNHKELITRLRGAELAFEPVKGCYQGVKEEAVLIPRVYGCGDLDVLQKTLFRYEQESALVLMPYETGDNAPLAFLCPSDALTPSVIRAFAQQTTRHAFYIGRFRLVSKDEALRSEAYTEKDGKYYVCVKEPWEMDANPELVTK